MNAFYLTALKKLSVPVVAIFIVVAIANNYLVAAAFELRVSGSNIISVQPWIRGVDNYL